jgi:cysteinyl-tRNA synthetase
MLDRYHPEVLRLFMLQSHYRSPVDFSDDSLSYGRLGMERFYMTLKFVKEFLGQNASTSDIDPDTIVGKDREMMSGLATLQERFTEAMDDDFNTARALGYVFDAVRLLNGYLADGKKTPSPQMVYVIGWGKAALDEIGGVLGLFWDDPDAYFEADRTREAVKRGLDVQEIERLVLARRRARGEKDWKKADGIRQILAEKKITLKDEPERTVWMIE